MIIPAAYFTTCGPVRSRNEDALLLHDRVIQTRTMEQPEFIQIQEEHIIMGIADGLGGAPAGSLASDIILKSVSGMPHLIENRNVAESTLKNLLKIMQRMVIDEPELEGLGAAATLISLSKERINILHIGDTRFYKIKKAFSKILLNPLTRDHTIAYELFQKRTIRRKDIEHHPQRNILTSCLCGYRESKKTDWFFRSFPLRKGRYLLASDGLWEHLNQIKDRSMIDSNLKESANYITEAVKLSHPRDNYSFILFDI